MSKIINITTLVYFIFFSYPLNSHILDCIQISTFIKNKKANIVDLGTGAGLPGIILVICGYSNVSLIDSNNKKIKFINYVAKNLNLSVNIIHSRIENINNTTFDYIISRALSKLDKLLFYSFYIVLKFYLKNTHQKDHVCNLKLLKN